MDWAQKSPLSSLFWSFWLDSQTYAGQNLHLDNRSSIILVVGAPINSDSTVLLYLATFWINY